MAAYSRHGGGAFSGKDPTKVDRSACYMARYIAKNLVAAGIAKRVEVQLAYAIGVAEPVSVMADSFGTGTIPDEQMTDLIRSCFRSPRAASSKPSTCAAPFTAYSGVRPFRPHRAMLYLGTLGQGRIHPQRSARRTARRSHRRPLNKFSNPIGRHSRGNYAFPRGRRQRHRSRRARQAQNRMGQSADARSAVYSQAVSSRSSR